MALLKEDGSLDVERINKLPFEERIIEISRLTSSQLNEYISKRPIKESAGHRGPVKSKYSLEEEIKMGRAILADDVLKIMKEKYLIKR